MIEERIVRGKSCSRYSKLPHVDAGGGRLVSSNDTHHRDKVFSIAFDQ